MLQVAIPAIWTGVLNICTRSDRTATSLETRSYQSVYVALQLLVQNHMTTWSRLLAIAGPNLHAYGRARNSVSRIVSEHGKINVATALKVHFCTCPVERTRACGITILGVRIVEKRLYCSWKRLYCSCVSVELRSDNFAARAS